MGYTHYMYLDNYNELGYSVHYDDALRFVRECIEDQGLQREYRLSLRVYPSRFLVEGNDDTGCETFVLYKTPPRHFWSFCKTNRNSYDDVVVGIHLIMSRCNGYFFSSDGDLPDMRKGWELVRRVLGMEIVPVRVNDKTIDETSIQYQQIMASSLRWFPPGIESEAAIEELGECAAETL